MTSKVKGPTAGKKMTAAEIARKQQRIPQFAKALGKGKTAIKGEKGQGLRRLNKGGFVKGPNS
jgi:hypothetical protein